MKKAFIICAFSAVLSFAGFLKYSAMAMHATILSEQQNIENSIGQERLAEANPCANDNQADCREKFKATVPINVKWAKVFCLYDITGKKIFEKKIAGAKELELQQTAGFYVYSLVSKDGLRRYTGSVAID